MRSDEQRYGKEHYAYYDGIDAPRKYSKHWWANRYFSRLIRQRVEGGRLLEIGFGTGHFLAEVGHHFQTYGIEISSFAISHARRNCPDANLQLLPTEDLGIFPEQFFDVIVSKHVFEHLEAPQTVLLQCARLLRPGGLLLYVVPNMESLMRHWKGSRWLHYRDETHVSLLYPREWVHLTEDGGLKIEKAFPDGFSDVPYVPWVPNFIQLIIFGSLGGIQALLCLSFLHIPLGESLVVLARKPYF